MVKVRHSIKTTSVTMGPRTRNNSTAAVSGEAQVAQRQVGTPPISAIRPLPHPSSPPPLRPSQDTPPQVCQNKNKENLDLLLPMIADDLDDEYLFSTRSGLRTDARLSFRPKKVTAVMVAPFHKLSSLDFVHVDVKTTSSPRTLIPLLEANLLDVEFALPMKTSRKRNPVLNGTC